ncbi:hypothetical protein [Rhizocola hellebori]|uniref:hypothetical protein n=1 Tax=Rhizocola hellebori TaxID=1392758 RepID=UPI001941EAB7|nr:hypothetical protein [Rhizocola hellebori]
MDENDGLSAELRRAIGMLSRGSEAQLAYLRELGVGDLADELALEFHDAFMVAKEQRSGSISVDAMAALEDLDARLARLSEDSDDAWRSASLRTSVAWADLRKAAANALRLLEVHAPGVQ